MIHTRIVSLVIVLSLVLFSNCTTAPKAKTSEPNKQATTDSAPAIASGDSIPVMKEWKARRFQLQNGLKVIVVTDHSSPTFAYQTWFNVGSRNEQKDYTGLAHLFEHLMFKATSNYADGEFSKQSEMAGAEGSNAFTTEDFTAYVQEFPKDKLDLIAQLESDRMVNLIVDENVFKTERDVVHNERRMRYENSADGILRLELKKMAYEKQPYRWPVIGYAEDLNRMTATDAVNFYKKYYHPSRAVIVVVGDVEFDQVKSTIEKNYGKIARAQVTSEELEPKLELETPLAQPIRNQLSLNTGVEKLRIAYRIPSATQIDQPPIKILGSINFYHTKARNI